MKPIISEDNDKPIEIFKILGAIPPLLTFTGNGGKKGYFDYKDGKWQFWGDAVIDESAKLFFEALGDRFENYIRAKILPEWLEKNKIK